MHHPYFHIWQKILFGSPKLLLWILEQYDFDAKKAWENFNPNKAPNARPETIDLIRETQVAADPEQEYENMRKLGMDILPLTDPNYPENLKNTAIPPVSLYFQGDLKCSQKPTIAIVGTRKISFYGQKIIRQIISQLEPYDITITSGLAYGIDAQAHTLSTRADLPNIAVLANGLDKLYPKPHTRLAQEIIRKNGAIISEAPPFVPAEKFMFPIRNRIIAGLAQATVIVEAPRKSGALITANYAFQENRLVYAAPGDITDYRQEGCHELIKNQKAILLTDASQIIDDLKLTTTNLNLKTTGISAEQTQILRALDRAKPTRLSDISNSAKITQRHATNLLIELEIAGQVKNVGAMHFIRM